MKTSEWSFTPFKGLKEALDSNNCILNSTKCLSEPKTDEEIFSEAMADVREIREFRAIPVEKCRKTWQQPVQRDDSLDILRQIVCGERKIILSDTDEYIEGTGCDIRKDILLKLHEGYFSVQDYIDLHGMTRVEAEEELSIFFKGALRKQLFCVKVIHGRGLRSPKGPVLKEALKRLLQGQFRKWILAYSSAKDCDGGLGATYIILKSK